MWSQVIGVCVSVLLGLGIAVGDQHDKNARRGEDGRMKENAVTTKRNIYLHTSRTLFVNMRKAMVFQDAKKNAREG